MERKEAIEVIKNHSSFPILRKALEALIPELKESDDEKIAKELIRYLHYCDDIAKDTKERWIAWLEKQGEQKSSWSEDDEAILEAIIQDIQERHPDAMWGIDTSKTAAVSTEFIIKFLKSLKPQYHWKPSEEQIRAFGHFVRSIGESGYASPYDNNTKIIYSLLNDLKNL